MTQPSLNTFFVYEITVDCQPTADNIPAFFFESVTSMVIKSPKRILHSNLFLTQSTFRLIKNICET